MMRPVLGKAFEISGVNDDPEVPASSLTIYPNPLNGNKINFRCEGKFSLPTLTNEFTVEIHNLAGIELFSGPFSRTIDTGIISPGLYIISVRDKQGQIISVSKLIKN